MLLLIRCRMDDKGLMEFLTFLIEVLDHFQPSKCTMFYNTRVVQ
jgi:hypothetical protein